MPEIIPLLWNKQEVLKKEQKLQKRFLAIPDVAQIELEDHVLELEDKRAHWQEEHHQQITKNLLELRTSREMTTKWTVDRWGRERADVMKGC